MHRVHFTQNQEIQLKRNQIKTQLALINTKADNEPVPLYFVSD